jgi:hypothetical protein
VLVRQNHRGLVANPLEVRLVLLIRPFLAAVLLAGGTLPALADEPIRKEWGLTTASEGPQGPFPALAMGDVDADGHVELLYGRRGDPRQLTALDGVTHAFKFTTGELNSGPQEDWPLLLVNVDDDAQLELITRVWDPVTSTGSVLCLDGSTRAEQWRTPVQAGQDVLGLAVADSEGTPKIVATVAPSLVEPAPLYLFDGATGALLETRSLDPRWGGRKFVRSGNLDDDPGQEIVVVEKERETATLVYVTAVSSGAPVRTQGVDISNPSAFELGDVDGDGRDDILIGTQDGRLFTVELPEEGDLFGFVRLTELWRAHQGGARIDAIRVSDLDHDGSPDLLVATGGEVVVLGRYGWPRWRSGVLGVGAGGADGVAVGDIDGDEQTEFMVNRGVTGFDVFEVVSAVPAHRPTFWVDDVTVSKRSGEAKKATFKVTLLADPTDTHSVTATTSDGTLRDGRDYVGRSDRLTFGPGVATLDVAVDLYSTTSLDNGDFHLDLTDSSGPVVLRSRATATVSQAPPTLVVEAPNGGERWQTGSVHTIRWRSTATSGSMVVYYWNADRWTRIGTTPGSGRSLEWTVPDTPIAETWILVRREDGPFVMDKDWNDGAFSIVGPVVPAREDSDFDAPGSSDIVWQHPDGRVYLWLMQGTRIQGNAAIQANALPGWRVAATGDFGSGPETPALDGEIDLVWQHDDGRIFVWFMRDTVPVSGAWALSTPLADWRVVGAGDLGVGPSLPDTDGHVDLVWQHTDGRIAAWFMDGARVTSNAFIDPVGSPGHRVVAAGDMGSQAGGSTPDGSPDLLMQTTTGDTYVRWLQGTQTTGTGVIWDPPNAEWHAVGNADVDRDGKRDVVWQHDTGLVYVWYLDGLRVTGGEYIYDQPLADWKVAAFK